MNVFVKGLLKERSLVFRHSRQSFKGGYQWAEQGQFNLCRWGEERKNSLLTGV